uniref:Uncharacterized protein LOC104248496 n=1 Tax=Nicotiana sylvestris TaxID=4096 RepID=A0A1U7YIW3_NICSY|nr:PREDICTED: uncharacterized protein LOC104248496 [Nicotiana sylvestris]
MEKDAKAFVQKCDKCHCYARLVQQPVEQLHSVLSLRQFMKQGMDIIGPLLSAPGKITNFFEDLKIKRITFSHYHPSANGQAESTNKVIIQNLKKRLDAAKGKWPEELPGVLWVYQTMTKSSTGETPVSLVYGGEALIPVEVREPILRYF